MQDLQKEIKFQSQMHERAITEMKQRGCVLADCERKYRVAKGALILKRREEGFPATLIEPIVNGEENIAKLRMERDISKTLYETAREAINAYRLNIKTIASQIDREWHSGGR